MAYKMFLWYLDPVKLTRELSYTIYTIQNESRVSKLCSWSFQTMWGDNCPTLWGTQNFMTSCYFRAPLIYQKKWPRQLLSFLYKRITTTYFMFIHLRLLSADRCRILKFRNKQLLIDMSYRLLNKFSTVKLNGISIFTSIVQPWMVWSFTICPAHLRNCTARWLFTLKPTAIIIWRL